MDECAGGAEGGVCKVDTEAFEVEDAKCLEDRLSARVGFEVVIGQRGDGAFIKEAGEAFSEGGGAIVGVPVLGRVFGHEDLTRIDAFEGGEQVFRGRVGGDVESTGGEIEPGGKQVVFMTSQSEEKVVAVGFDLIVGETRAGGNDAGKFALNQLARLGGLYLISDRNLNPPVEQLLHIVVRSMVGDTGHGHAVAVGQGYTKQFRPLLCILLKDLIEIA